MSLAPLISNADSAAPRRATRLSGPHRVMRLSGPHRAALSRVALLLLLAFLCASTSARAQTPSPAPARTPTPAQRPAASPTPARKTSDEASATAATSETSAAATSETAAAASHATGSITGRVVGEGGEPLVDAAVSLFARGLSVSRPTIVSTGEDGRFRFDNLAPAAYALNPIAPGYVPVLDPSLDRNARKLYYLGDNVQLTMTKGGVITGMVTDADGKPVVAARVRAALVRGPEGRALESPGAFSLTQETDDRGIYRIYGLPAGSYIVSTGGSRPFTPFPSAYDEDAPTFYPSSSREGAVEVAVQTGQEASGIDIRYRAERGRAISGTVVGLEESSGGTNILLTHAATGMLESNTFTTSAPGETGTTGTFRFDGIADGEYDIVARRYSRDGEQFASSPVRIRVRGADVTGLRLTLNTLASLSGRVQYDTTAAAPRDEKSACEARPVVAPEPQETVISLRRDDRDAPKDQPRAFSFSRPERSPDARGQFLFRGVDEGRYRLEVALAGEAWYVRSIALTPALIAPALPKAGREEKTAANVAASAARQPSASPLRDGFTLRQGQRLTGVVVQLAHGAASLRGQIAGDADARLERPAQWRIYLVPADREQAEDPLRYSEAPLTNEQTFAFTNLAPGRYLILARPLETNATGEALRPAAWDEAERARLRREAEAANIILELQPCQRLEGFALRSPPAHK